MRLSFIEVEGFRGFRSRVRVPIPHGFVVVTGRNGSGKSSICDAVEFAIAGTISKYGGASEKAESWDDYVWWRGDLSAEQHYVTVGFVDSEGREVTVTRSPSGLELSGAEILEDVLCSPGMAPRDSLAQLCRTALIRDETITAHSIDLTERERYAFVRAAIGTDALERVEEEAKQALESLRRRQAELQEDYARARQEVTGLVAQLSEARGAAREAAGIPGAEDTLRELLRIPSGGASDLQQRARQAIAELRLETENLSRWARESADLREQLANLETSGAVQRIEELRSVVGENERAATSALDDVQRLEKSLTDSRSSRTVHDRLAAVYENGAAVGLRNGACPLCRTEMTPEAFADALEQLGRELEGIARQIATDERQLLEARRKHDSVLAQTMAAREELDRIGTTVRVLSERRGRLVEAVASFGIPAGGILDAGAFASALEQETERLLALERAAATLESSGSVDRVISLEQRIKSAQEVSDRVERSLAATQEAAARSRALVSGVRRAFGEVVEERLASLEPLLKELYERLQPHADWRDIGYHMRGEVRRFLSLQVGQDLNPRFVFSSGQRRAAGLVFLLAVHLSRPWCRLRTLILDDPVQHIDDFRALHLVELLAALRATGEQVICTVEDPALADLLCRRLRKGVEGEGVRITLQYRLGEGAVVQEIERMPGPRPPVLLTA